MRAFVLYVNEEVILSFKVIRLAEVAVNVLFSEEFGSPAKPYFEQRQKYGRSCD